MDYQNKQLQNIKYLLYKNNIFKLSYDLQVSNPSFVLFPFPINRISFNEVKQSVTIFNSVINSLSRNRNLLYSSLESFVKNDVFVENLVNISKKSSEFPIQTAYMGIFRNDFMLCQKSNKYKQIEFNTIAASLSFMSDNVRRTYEEMIKLNMEGQYERYKNRLVNEGSSYEGVLSSIVLGHNYFLKKQQKKNEDCIIIVVIGENERNIVEFINIQFDIIINYNTNCERLTLSEIGKLSKDENFNYIYKDKIVSIFYFRTGYEIENFNQIENGWKIREEIEISTSIKIPNIDTLIVTLKKFQEVLNNKDILIKLLSSVYKNESQIEEKVNLIMNHFVRLYDYNNLDNQKKEEIIHELYTNHNNYIVKLMKEGGNKSNYNYEEVKEIGQTRNENILNKSIIMERIFPIEYENYVFRENNIIEQEKMITEIGLYSSILSDIVDGNIIEIENRQFGILFRTKNSKKSDVGINVNAGYINYGYFSDE